MGNKIPLLLADQCVRYLPEVVISICSPCYNGQTMETPFFDLIIGNNIFERENYKTISGDDSEFNCCVLA
jgi:hypothetical protein